MIGPRFNLSRHGAALVLATLVSLGAFGVSAQAGLADSGAVAARAPTISAGDEGQDHFPGAALLYASEEAGAAPLPGATGTTALPDMPVPEIALTETSVRPAPPFALRGTLVDRARALQCLTTAIYYEAASEPDAGQAAVAQVILNRVRHPAFPASVCGVVYQGSERSGCQFSFACDGSMARVPMRSAYERARRAAWAALNGVVFAGAGMATHYHTYAVTPSWGKTLVMTGVYGAHFFHRWKGWWGTPAAFRQGYSGIEPVPGPHPRAGQPLVIAAVGVMPPAAVRDARALSTPAANIVAEHRDSGTLLARYAGDALPGSTVLDKWKDSGKPLR